MLLGSPTTKYHEFKLLQLYASNATHVLRGRSLLSLIGIRATN